MKYSKTSIKLGLNQATYLTLDRAIQVLSTLLTNALVARALNVEVFGQWQLAMAWLFFMVIINNFVGMDTILPLFSRNKNFSYQIITQSFKYRLSITLCLMVSCFVICCVLLQDNKATLILISLLPLLMREPFMVFGVYFISQKKTKYYFMVSFISLLVRLVCLYIVFISNNSSFHNYVIPMYVENFIFIGGLLLIWSKETKKLKKCYNQQLTLDILKRGAHLWISMVALLIALRIDRIILAGLLDKEQFGLYSAAAQFNDNWYYVGVILYGSIAPHLIYNENSFLCNKKAIKISLQIGLILIVMASLVVLLSNKIMTLLYGESFYAAGKILSFTVWSAILLPLDMLLSSPLLYRGQTKIQMIKGFIMLLLIPILIYYFYPLLGLYCAPAAIGLSMTIQLIATYLILRFQNLKSQQQPAF